MTLGELRKLSLPDDIEIVIYDSGHGLTNRVHANVVLCLPPDDDSDTLFEVATTGGSRVSVITGAPYLLID